MRLARVLLALLSAPLFAQRVITTVAGTDWLFPGDGLPAKNAPISGASGLDVGTDANGNYYIADAGNFMVFRVSPDGTIHTLAGNGINYPSGDNGLAVNAGLFLPIAIAVDPAGNVYISEYDSRIRRVDAITGNITAFAGDGQDGSSGDNGPALQARINGPGGLAVDAQGNLYIADTYNNRIRKVNTAGIITTIAGTGEADSVGDNVPALSAKLYFPTRITVDGAGNVYFIETIQPGLTPIIRKIDTKGIITTVAGKGFDVSDGAAALQAPILPIAIHADATGNVYFADIFTGDLRKIDTKGIITTIAGVPFKNGFSGDGGPATQALLRFSYAAGIGVDPSGNIYVADDGNDRVRKIALTDGSIDTVTGNGLFRFSGDGGPATGATLDFPASVVGDAAGNLYVSEPDRARIRRIAPDGTISVLAGNRGIGYTGDGGPAASAAISFPEVLNIAPDGSLLFGDAVNCVVRSISPAGIISTVAGSGQCNDSGDGGPALKAAFRGPFGAAYDESGNLIISDTFNHRIRRVRASDGQISTIAGDGTAGFAGDGGDGRQARLDTPGAVRIYNGGIYFADMNNNRIRRIDSTTLTITTVAGNGKKAFAGDGGKATSASLTLPQSVAFDTAGNMYIADTRSFVVRKVDAAGMITTVVGSPTAEAPGDGGSATDAGIVPGDVYVDSAGTIFLADDYTNRIRAALVNPPTFNANPPNLAFTAPAGSTALEQKVDVTGSISGVPFTATSSAPWLQASPSSGRMPAGLRVIADPSGLTAGSYQANLTITAPNTKSTTQVLSVSFTVTAAGQPSLSVKPSGLASYAVVNSPAVTRGLALSNLGGGSLPFTVTTSGGRWLSISASSGTLNAFGSTTLVATLNPTGLAPGSYSGIVTVAATNSPQSVTVPVTMTVSAVEQSIVIPQTGLTFYAVEGGGSPPPQLFNILNGGRGQMPFATSVSTLTGGGWLTASPRDGTSDANSPIVPQVRVQTDPANLKAGVYYGSVQVTAATAANTPQFVSVVLNVLPAGSRIGPIVQPTGIIFTAPQGSSPGSQTVLIQSTSTTPVTFASGRTTVDGGTWLRSLPPEGTLTKDQPLRVVIQPETADLAAAVYRGSLTLSFSDGSVRVIAIVVVIVPNPTGAKTVREASCAPKTLVPVFTQLSPGFAATAGFPGQVSVAVVDDCGQPMTTGDVITTFSNGDPPLRLISLKDGNWVATWTPERVVSPITVVADAAVPDQNLKGQVRLSGSLTANDVTPVVGAGAVLNGASFALQAALAPGSFVSLFGSKLAQSPAQASSVPLPTNLGGVSVLVGGREIPLYYASDGQLNAILPYGLAVNTTQQVIVSRGNSISVPQSIAVAPAAPGVFMATAQGQGIVVEGVTQRLADTANPVHAGQTVVIYCTGLGDVVPAVSAGSPTPGSPLTSTVNPVNVTIGGLPAAVSFAGLTPGSTGLYQINAVIPNGAPAGDQVPLVVSVAGQTSSPVTIAIR